MTTVNVAEAKARLSSLLDAAERGEEVVLARNGTPIARLVPIAEPSVRQLGFLPICTPDERFDALREAELEGWV